MNEKMNEKMSPSDVIAFVSAQTHEWQMEFIDTMLLSATRELNPMIDLQSLDAVMGQVQGIVVQIKKLRRAGGGLPQ